MSDTSDAERSIAQRIKDEMPFDVERVISVAIEVDDDAPATATIKLELTRQQVEQLGFRRRHR